MNLSRRNLLGGMAAAAVPIATMPAVAKMTQDEETRFILGSYAMMKAGERVDFRRKLRDEGMDDFADAFEAFFR